MAPPRYGLKGRKYDKEDIFPSTLRKIGFLLFKCLVAFVSLCKLGTSWFAMCDVDNVNV